MELNDIRVTKKKLLEDANKRRSYLGKDEIWRAQGYTTEGHFLIKTELEGKILSKLKSAQGAPPVDRVIPKDINSLFNFEIENITVFEDILDGNRLVIYLKRDDKGVAVVNAYFYKYLVKDGITIHQKKDPYLSSENSVLQPLILIKENEFVGMIMPIRRGDK